MNPPFLHGRALAAVLGVAAAATIVLGFFIQVVTLSRLGPGIATDALFAALAVPQVVVVVAGNPIAAVLVPLLATREPGRAAGDAWAVSTLVALGFGLLSLLLAASAAGWVPLTAPGFSAEGRALAVRLARVQLWGMACMGTAAAVRSVYHARRAFVWAACAAVIAAAAGLLWLLWRLPQDGVVAAAWAYVIRAGVELVLLLPALGRFRPPAWRSPLLARFWAGVRAPMAGLAYERTEILVDRVLASLAPAGGLSLLYFGQQIYGAVGQVVNRGVTLPALPQLAQDGARGRWGDFRRLYRGRLGVLLGVTLGCFVLVALAGRPALSLAFGARQVTGADLRLLWLLLLLLGGQLVGEPVNHLLLNSFYAAGDTRTPTLLGVAVYTVGMGLKVAGFFWFGLLGLAAATSGYYLLRAAALGAWLGRRAPAEAR